MMEWIREYNMGTMSKKRDKCKKWQGEWCPIVRKTLDKLTLRLKECTSQKSDDFHFQITQRNGDRYNVDLIRKECSCRRYDLTGMPCLHVVSAVAHLNGDVFQYVNKCYSTEMYKKCFEGAIYGINGQELWGQTFFIPPLPPNFGRKGQKGKPEKARRLGFDETKNKKKKNKPGPQQMKRQQHTLTCSYCRAQGHNYLTCKSRAADLEEEAMMLATEEDDDLMHMWSNAAVNQDQDVPVEVITQDEVQLPQVASVMAVKPQRKQKTLGLVNRYKSTDVLVPGPSMEQQLAQYARPPPPSKTMLHPKLNIRAPPPMVGNQFLLNAMPHDLVSSQQSSSKVPSFVIDGKKYVTLSNLTPALEEMQKTKGKGKKKVLEKK